MENKMKITTGFVAGLLASLLASGSAHAKVCSTPVGQVTGLLSLSPPIAIVNTTNVTCLANPDAPFGWDNLANLPADPDPADVFTTSANLTLTGIEITMYTGATGGFTSDMVWTLTLPNGSLFDFISDTPSSSNFVFDDQSWVAGGTLSCTGEGTSSAVCTILAAGGINPDNEDEINAYDFARSFTGIFDIRVSPQNAVPEPAGWVATLTCLGILGVVRRRTNNLRSGSEDATAWTRACKVLS
jgi:hypothetical protein